MSSIEFFGIEALLEGYRTRRFSPLEVIETAFERAARVDSHNIWITRLSAREIEAHLERLRERDLQSPLYGIPFVIKDNLDLAGVPTTAACPEFAYVPARSAPVVERLLEAGAIPLGKTNLDQFATGLAGTRSPYGVCRNSVDPNYISGGSSSGSAVAVATGIASFALGTDTAGSGRIPAAFNNLIGLKPSLGRLSSRGVVPACRSLDCISIFALTAPDAGRILALTEGFDAEDPYSRPVRDRPLDGTRVGIPRADQLEFYGDEQYARLFERAKQRLRSLGYSLVAIDVAPFLEAARLLYEGPWTAERYVAIESLLATRPESLHPVTRAIIEGGAQRSAVETFKALHRLEALRRCVQRTFSDVDMIMTPTAATVYEARAVLADPIALNTRLGYYTNGVNLLDLAAVAVPAGFRSDGLPFGVSLLGPRDTDLSLLAHAARLHRDGVETTAALAWPVPPPDPIAESLGPIAGSPAPTAASEGMALAVCGAHMQGLALNHQLLERGGRLLRRLRTAPCYRLFALPGGQRPGLLRVHSGGAPIDIEVWSIHPEALASLIAGIPRPLGIGRVELEDGSQVAGFLCEAYATDTARDITEFGSWRGFLHHQALKA
jgi:allophanate hydrolase